MKIAFFLYEGMTALDFVGPLEILSRLPNASIQLIACKEGPVAAGSGLVVNADYAFADIAAADVLVVPGSASATTFQNAPEVLAWIRQMHATTTWTTSVCTGSLILGAAGVLTGLKATTHWAVFDRLSRWGGVPTHRRVVEDGKVMTAAGVSAGIDMGLILAARLVGSEYAQAIQLALEYDPEPPFDVGSPEKAPKEILEPLQLRMQSRFEQ